MCLIPVVYDNDKPQVMNRCVNGMTAAEHDSWSSIQGAQKLAIAFCGGQVLIPHDQELHRNHIIKGLPIQLNIAPIWNHYHDAVPSC
jgi:hypothetical protein